MVNEIYALPLNAHIDGLPTCSFTLWSRDAAQYDAAVDAALKALGVPHLFARDIRCSSDDSAADLCTATLNDGRTLVLRETDADPATPLNYIDD